METQDILEKKIGTKDIVKLKPAKAIIKSVEIQTETRDGKKMKSPLINIVCKHPDQEEVVRITKVKYEATDGNLKVIGLWGNLDDDGNIQKSSALAELLRISKVETAKQLVGKEVELVVQSKDDNWLCIKAY